MNNTSIEQLDELSARQRALLRSLWIRTSDHLAAALEAAATGPNREERLEPGEWSAVCRRLGVGTDQTLEAIQTPGGFGFTIPTATRLAFEANRTLRRSGPMRLGAPSGLPPSVTLVPLFPPVRDQGRRGTCVAFASVALREHALAFRETLSEQFLYWACKDWDGDTHAGTQLTTAIETLRRHGVCREALWPYAPEATPGNEGHEPPPREAIRDALRFRFPGCRMLSDHDATFARQVLAGREGAPGQPVVVGVLVFQSSFLSRRALISGELSLPLPGENPVAGHAMCIVGYQDDPDVPGGGYFIVRNSWGTRWAQQGKHGAGHALMPYAYFENYAVQAMIGPSAVVPDDGRDADSHAVVVSSDPLSRFLHQVPANVPQAGRREWLGFGDAAPLGALLPTGRDVTVLASPERAAEFRMDSAGNRELFLQQWFAWSAAGAEDVAHAAMAAADPAVRALLTAGRTGRERYVGAIDENLRQVNGRPFPYVHEPWIVRLAPYEWEPKVRAVERLADLDERLLEQWESQRRPANARPWPQAVRRAFLAANALRVYRLHAFDTSIDVVVGWLTPVDYRGGGRPVRPVLEVLQPGHEILDCARRAHARWLEAQGAHTPSFTFFTYGFAGPRDSIPSGLVPSSSSSHREIFWAFDDASRLVAAIPDRFCDRLSLRDFGDRLLPLTFRERVSCIKTIVDDIRDEGHRGRITVDMVRDRTRLRECLTNGRHLGYRQSLVLDAFLKLQDEAPGLYRVEKHDKADDLTRGGAGVARVHVVHPDQSSGVRVTLRSVRKRFIRRHGLRILANLVTGGVALAFTLLGPRLGLSQLQAFFLSLPFAYLANLAAAWLNRRADHSEG